MYSSWLFREPVNPELLGIPTYFDVIPPKDARDLKTIRQKLDSDKYESMAMFEADIELMVRNAIKFNGAESDVGHLATVLRNRVSEMLANAKAGSEKKRKDGEKPMPMAKKPKLDIGPMPTAKKPKFS
jgi:transcription initiation factor TFIID subunit 2